MWFGEFLYRNGVISSEQLTVAMGEYYSSREPIGKLALHGGMLSIKEVNKILGEQADDPAPFGKVAVRLGLLRQEQVEMLIGRQSFTESLWDFLVRKEYLSKESLEYWLVQFHSRSNFPKMSSTVSATG